VACEVIAPSLIPRRPGERTKTDRLDALKLSRYYRAGELTAVHVPTVEEEADRSLVRYRMGLVRDVTRTKNRILKVLDRHGIRYTEGKTAFTRSIGSAEGGALHPGEEYAYRSI